MVSATRTELKSSYCIIHTTEENTLRPRCPSLSPGTLWMGNASLENLFGSSSMSDCAITVRLNKTCDVRSDLKPNCARARVNDSPAGTDRVTRRRAHHNGTSSQWLTPVWSMITSSVDVQVGKGRERIVGVLSVGNRWWTKCDGFRV